MLPFLIEEAELLHFQIWPETAPALLAFDLILGSCHDGHVLGSRSTGHRRLA